MKRMPSRLKIALLSAGISGIVLVIFAAAMWTLIRDMRMEAVDREIRTLGARHPGLLVGRGNYERLGSSLQSTFGEDFTNRVVLLLTDNVGRTLYASPQWPAHLTADELGAGLEKTSDTPPANPETNSASSVTEAHNGAGRWSGATRGFGMGRGGPPPNVVFTKPPKFFTSKIGDASWRFGALGNNEINLMIGLNQQEVEDELNRVRAAFLLTLPAALFVVGLGGWVVAGRALRPLQTIADTAERITARGLGQRIPESRESSEAARFIRVFNRMMDRLETSFHQATRFSADASHELKTPVAVMQGELENALQSAAASSGEQQLFSSLLDQTQRLKTIMRSLLLLAQADAGQLKLALEPVDLSADLDAMVEDARALAAESRLRFEVEIQRGAEVEADRTLLHTALFNLIHNAVKYNEPGGSLAIRLSQAEEEDRIVFSIGNSGPGIPAESRDKIFERFHRGHFTKRFNVDGIGLGLSLAREIARAHHGDLLLRDSRPGWTCFELTLNPSARKNAD